MPISLRYDLLPGDLEVIIDLHGAVYAAEYGWGVAFKGYVAEALRAGFQSPSPRNRLWIAEQAGAIVGCIAIVAASIDAAQLRFFLVDPSVRGHGLGSRLMSEALDFAKQMGYGRVFLWTEQSLKAAARIYEAAGFVKTEVKTSSSWGVEVVEE